MRPGYRLRLGAAVPVVGRPDACEGEQRALVGEREPDHIFFLVSEFGSGAYSAKLLSGTKQRFSGFSHMRQCGEDVLLMLVTGGPLVRGGGGMPQRIIVISRSPPELRITGAG